jgi:hypothetical protein
MAAADPSAPHRALAVEAFRQLRRQRDTTGVALMRDAAAARERAALTAAAAPGEAAAAAPPGSRARQRLPWAAVAAWLEARVAKRVFARGAGERHVARPTTYPAFEVRRPLRGCC